MPKSAGTDPGTSKGVGSDIEYDVIGARGIAGDSAHARQMVEPKIVADAPGDIVIGARSVTTDSNSASDYLARTVERESSTEDVDTANLVTHHRILGGADFTE